MHAHRSPTKTIPKIENGSFFFFIRSFENSSPQLAMIMRKMYCNVLYYNRSNCGSNHFWHNERRLIDLTWRKRRNKGKVRTEPYTESTENNEKIHCTMEHNESRLLRTNFTFHAYSIGKKWTPQPTTVPASSDPWIIISVIRYCVSAARHNVHGVRRTSREYMRYWYLILLFHHHHLKLS